MNSIRIEAGSTPFTEVMVRVDQAINEGVKLIHCVGLDIAGQKNISAKCYEARVGFQADDGPPEFPIKGCSSVPILRCR